VFEEGPYVVLDEERFKAYITEELKRIEKEALK